MANQTWSANGNFDDAGKLGLANGETVTVDSGAVLTINSDMRWGQQAAVPGAMTISSATGGEILIDGTTVWWIAYDGGASTVPAIGDTITGATSGATGEFIGLFTAYGVAPSAGGGATPATGFIKLRSKSGDFQDNENLQVAGVTKAVVNSATGGKRGWLHMVGVEATTITVPRLGKLTVTGDWFELDTTCSGSRNQTIQLPVADHYPGVWIETGSGTGIYEFYPNAGVQQVVANFLATSTDDRGKTCYVSSGGLLRIGASSAGVDCAFLPASGCKIRIPNIMYSSTTSANYAANTLSATLATRYDLTTTAAGDIDIDKMIGAGFYPSMTQAYSVSITNSAFLDQMVVSEVPTPVILTNVGFGTTATLIAAAGTCLALNTCFAGGMITNCHFMRITMAASTVVNILADLDGFTFSGCKTQQLAQKAANTPQAWGLTRLSNCTFTDNIIVNCGPYQITTCQNMVFTNTLYADRSSSATNTSNPTYAFNITTGCNNIKIDGFDNYDSLANVHPYTGIVSIASFCANIKVRNIGTAASPYNCGSANATGVLVQISGTNSNIKVQRVYATNTRTSPFGTMVNSDFGIVAECVWGDAADTGTIIANDMIAKGCRWTNSTTGQTSVYGSHWSDIWVSTTAGRIVLQMNEKTAEEPSASSYSIVSGTPKFTSTGNLYLGTVGDEILFEMPYYAQGITSFAPATKTQPTFTGTNPNNHDIYYKIDKNDGLAFNAAYRNLAYKRAGAGGSGGTFVITMTSTTGVAVGDYVFGTGVGTNAKVVTIDSGTNITVDVANSGAVSGVLVFNQLPSETGITAANGVKLKIRILCNATSATNVVTYLRIDTVTTSSDQNAVAYPLDPVTVKVTVKDINTLAPIENARVFLETDPGAVNIFNDLTDVNGIVQNTEYAFTANQDVTGRARKATGAYYKTAPIVGTITESGLELTIFLIPDA